MNTPYHRRPLRLTAADREAWRQYEAAAKRAAEQYKRLPIAHQRALCDEPTGGQR